jgi:acyl-CoA synthetase (AMP-forming)/AMP-acid ligase II
MPDATLVHHLLGEAAARTPDAPAYSRGGVTLTYAEMDAASRRLGGWLVAQGLRTGDRLVIAADHAYVPALIFAASRAGVAFAIVHEQVRGAVLEYMLDDCEPMLVLADRTDWQVAATTRGIATVPTELLTTATAADVDVAGPIAVDMLCLIYTSGSTAMPKAVVSTHQQALFAIRAIAGQLGYRSDDVIYSALPLSFDYGLYQLFLGALAGAHVRAAFGSEAGPSLLAGLIRANATVFPALPNLADTLARLLRRNPVAPPLRLMTNTGSAMSPAILAALRESVPGLRVQLMFGLTECKRVAIMPADGDLARPGSGGLPLPGTEVFAVDEDGNRQPPGVVGELVVRGPHVMAGYWRQPDLTAARFRCREGLLPQLHTGDYGWLDEQGYLFFAGRRDDQYKAGGVRVSAVEVEAAACRIDGVRRAGVVPPGPGRPAAVLFVATGLSAEAVLTALRRELEDLKVPPTCVVVDELPVNGNGKVDKRALGRVAADAH